MVNHKREKVKPGGGGVGMYREKDEACVLALEAAQNVVRFREFMVDLFTNIFYYRPNFLCTFQQIFKNHLRF